MTLHLTALFAGLLILIQIALTTMVGVYRGKTGIDFLHGDDDVLLKRMRAHGNFTETVPITLIAMALAELAGRSAEHSLNSSHDQKAYADFCLKKKK